MRQSAAIECVWPAGALLGEGPVWDARTGHLWFVDIKCGRIYRYDPATGERVVRETGGNPCFLLPAQGGGLVMGNGQALYHLDGDMQREIARVAMPATNRLNDATVDPAGRVWFGSMDDREAERTGAVHVYDAGSVHVAGGAATITNGPAVSGDGRWLYHVDTADGIVWRFDVSQGPQLRDGEPFVRIDADDGAPDGVVLDAEDHLWVALWGGGGVRRYAPDGTLVAAVALPCDNVTKLAFGGEDLRTAYVTTARVGLDDDALARQPLAGGLFAFRTDVPGRILPLVHVGEG